MKARILGVNHAVLYVREARRSAEFYERILGFVSIIEDDDGAFVFLRANGSQNHHDLALFSVGTGAQGSSAGSETVGLYHIAWEVPTLDDLRRAACALRSAGALVGASDHGVNKSIYAHDPDGLELEVTWVAPSHAWGDDEHRAIVRPLDLSGAESAYGASRSAS
jgi:catechol-2,3-dioxygenase